jgi:hypothetical protein
LKHISWRIHERERPEIDESLSVFSIRSRANEQDARNITVLMFHGNEEVKRGTRGIRANKQHAPKGLEVVRRIVLAASSSGVSVQKAKTAHYLPIAWVSILHVRQTSWRRQSSRTRGDVECLRSPHRRLQRSQFRWRQEDLRQLQKEGLCYSP